MKSSYVEAFVEPEDLSVSAEMFAQRFLAPMAASLQRMCWKAGPQDKRLLLRLTCVAYTQEQLDALETVNEEG